MLAENLDNYNSVPQYPAQDYWQFFEQEEANRYEEKVEKVCGFIAIIFFIWMKGSLYTTKKSRIDYCLKKKRLLPF